MKEIIPKFVARPYQRAMLRAFFVDGKKRLLAIWHRRAGKDTLAFQLMWIAAMERKGLYLYLAPIISQAASIIWHGRGKDGTTFLDYIPKQLIKKINQSTMSITLINGSILRVTGSNNWESIVGSNPLGVVYSEFQNSDLRAWEYIRPILSENLGWAAFTATPRGFNHLYDLYQTNKDNPEWHVEVLTVDETTLNDGLPVITLESIDEERKAGMPENVIAQEFRCSFVAALTGAYYADEMALTKEQGRIYDFPIDPNIPVHTSWDLGISDATSICLFQVMPMDGTIKVIYHFEEGGKELAHYAWKLERLKTELGFKRYGEMFFPHDIRVRELGSGLTRVEQLHKCGISPRIVGNHLVIERIQCVRAMMYKVHFLEKNCKHLIRALSEYRARWDEKNKVSTGPIHDNFSHACDSFGYFAVGHLEFRDPTALSMQKKYASFIP